MWLASRWKAEDERATKKCQKQAGQVTTHRDPDLRDSGKDTKLRGRRIRTAISELWSKAGIRD